MKLYPYQQKIFDSVISYLSSHNKVMIVMPTGSGKTVVFSHIIKYLNLKTLIVAHTKELITQSENTLRRVGVKNCEVRTIQSCYMHPDIADEFEMLIVDECHRSHSPSYLKLIDKFSNKKLIGVTATPFRSDGQWLFNIYGEKISPLSIMDMIESGLLCDFEGYRIQTNISLKGISTKDGDFISSKLSPIINTTQRNQLIVKSYKEISIGKKSLCFAVDISHADELAKEFQKEGIPSKSLHGKIPKLARERIIQDFKNDHIDVLISCQLLTEGFDEPSIECLLLARPTKSKVLYMQMIGRGSRLYPGKSICHVLEFTDNTYDVCDMEQLLGSSSKMHSINKGERFSDYYRKPKPLIESDEDLQIEKYKLIKQSFASKPASEWQKKFMTKLGISFTDDTSEIEANNLIARITNV